MIRWMAGGVLACIPAALLAQTNTVVGTDPSNVVHVGTPIQLKILEELATTNHGLKVGQRFDMGVLQPVMAGPQVLIAAGSHAVGEITSVNEKGMWGKSGGFTARVLYVEANGRRIRLNGSFNDRGDTGTGGVLASAMILPVAGFFVTGTSARLPLGAHVTAFVGEEVAAQSTSPIAVAPVAPSPMATPTPAVGKN